MRFFPRRHCRILSCAILLGFTTLSHGSTIFSNFNGTAIPVGRYLWFNAHLSSYPEEAGTIQFINQKITVEDPATAVYDVPDAIITFVAGHGTHTLTFNVGLDR